MSNRNEAPRTSQPRKLPQEIYMRRRVAALVVVLVVVALIIWLLTSLGGGNNNSEETSQAADTQAVTTEAAPASSADEAPAEAPADTEAAEAKESPYPEPTQPTEAPEELAKQDSCELKDLNIRVESDRPSYEQGQLPTFYAIVDNPTGVDCDINLDENQLRFEVFRLKDYAKIWADVNCYPPVEGGQQVFIAGEERSFDAVWSRLESAPGQCNGRPGAAADSYMVYAAIGDKVSAPVTFNLRTDT